MLKMLILILMLTSIKSENSPNKSDLDSIMAVFGPKEKQASEEINSSVSMVSDSDDAEGQVGKASDDIKAEKKTSSYLKESKMMPFEDSDYKNKIKGGYDEILESALKKGKKRHFNGNNRKDGYKKRKFKEDVSESNLDSSERLKSCKKTNDKLRKKLRKYESQSSSKRSKNNNFKKYNEKKSKVHKISEDENKSDVFDRISSDSLDNSDSGSQKKNKAQKKTQYNKRSPKSKDKKKVKSHDYDSEISEFEHSMKG